MKTEADFSDSICPLCGKGNQCAMSTGDKSVECWCMDAKIEAETLGKLPAQWQGKVCICQACASPEGKS